MKSTIIRYGVWSTLFLIGICVIPLLFTGLPGPDDFKRGEIIGYTSIVLSMVFVVLGMRQYRDENGGVISYGKVVKTGLMIAVFPAVAFALYNLLYIFVIDPEFLDKYAEYSLADRGAGKTAEELVAIKQAVMDEQKMFENPIIQFILMFLTVFVIGGVVSLISGFFVKKSSVA